MKNFKFISALLILFVLLTSCSYFKSTTTKNNDESHKIEGETPVKEKVLEKTSQADLTFYNKYIELPTGFWAFVKHTVQAVELVPVGCVVEIVVVHVPFVFHKTAVQQQAV